MIEQIAHNIKEIESFKSSSKDEIEKKGIKLSLKKAENADLKLVVVSAKSCLLYTSPSPRDRG